MAASPPAGTSAASRFVFLDYLRAIAAWLVVWDHVVADQGGHHGLRYWGLNAVRSYVAEPLGIIQDFGWLAVVLFFLISGFIITHVAMREGVGEFAIKRFFRIYPMLALFSALSCVLLPASVLAPPTLAQVLESMTMFNFLHVGGHAVVGVAWTLVIEVLFYALTALTMGLRRPLLSLAANFAIVVGILANSHTHGDNFFMVAANVAYLPYLICGQVLYLGLHARLLRPLALAVCLAGSYAAALFGVIYVQTPFLAVGNSYLISSLYAVGIFCLFLRCNDALPSNRVVRFLADTSFSVYLVHGIIGLAAFYWAYARWGVQVAVPVDLAVTVAAAALIHRWVERPLLAYGRRLARPFRLRDRADVSPPAWLRPKRGEAAS